MSSESIVQPGAFRRSRAILFAELRAQILRPMFWIMVGLLVLVSWGLSSGGLTISTGDSSIGGQKAWLNSQYNLSLTFILVGFLLYCFFAAIAAGMSIIRDDENGVSEILHSTPLTPSEYVLAKFAGTMMALGIAVALHLIATVLFYQFLPVPNPEEVRGPFRLANYLIPTLLFTLPTVWFFAGIAFFFGERTRKPILVFVVPLAVFLSCAFFLWGWSPTWLDPRANRLLMILEPSGFRWLNETLLQVDRGVEYYNNQPLALDTTFWINRLWVLTLPLLAVLSSVRHFGQTISDDLAPGFIQRLARRLPGRRRATTPSPSADSIADATAPATSSFSELGMTARRPSLWRGIAEVARAEFRELRNQPGLYIFVPLILLQILGSSLFALGAFETPILLTSGTIAVRSLNTITFLVCLLLLFYTVESISRDRNTGFDSLIYSTPMTTASILFGKAVANSMVGVVVVIGAFLGAAIAMLIQGQAPLQLWPFLLVWGVLLLPTFMVWNAWVTAVQAMTRNRYSTYGVGIATIALTFYHQFQGNMTWLWNWNLWGALNWSDMSVFELDRSAILLNRVTAIGVAIFLTMLSVRFFSRRDLDASRVVHRLSPRSLFRGSLRLLPWALLPIITGSVLAHQVRSGPQSEKAEKRQKDYWRKNLATYRDYESPSIQHLELDLELFPERSGFEARGSYRFENHKDETINEIVMTVSAGLEDLEWTIDGEKIEEEDRSDLHVLELPRALEPGDTVTVGFSHHGAHPYGVSKNGGGTGTFILPSGVVLHIFGPMFLPLPGYYESIGIDEDNSYEPKQYPPDFWKDELEPALGSIRPFTTRARITAPADLTVNAVGELVEEQEQDGKRTVVWQSDYPVKLFNIVAGRWEAERRDGVALFHHPQHDYNTDEILSAMQAAREHYSKWFYPYPWKELKISEFPGLAGYAQGFPTNITFSEQIGFLTESDPKTKLAFMVTAHEIAHQWWGNLVTPGRGPGGNILSEGMSHYSTILLLGEAQGEQERIEFCKRIEERYGEGRQVDSERPLVEIDGSRAGDATVTYDKGGWVMWMLHDLMGHDQAIAGLQKFVAQAIDTTDSPVLQDLIESLRPFAPDQDAYQSFVDQWYFDVVVPEYRLSDLHVEQVEIEGSTRFRSEVKVENVGTGSMPIEIAATRGVRFPDDEEEGQASEPQTPYSDARTTITLGAGEAAVVELLSDFEPERILVDPDARVLQLRREQALIEVDS